MKKLLIYAVFLFFSLMFLIILTPVYGQNSGKDLDLGNTGLLPSNPFYFVKEWSRSLKKVFTFDPVKRLELMIDIFNQKVAELKKLVQVDPDKKEAINKAIGNYEAALADLTDQVSSIKTADLANFDKHLTRITALSLKHFSLLTELKIQFRNNQLENGFEFLTNKIVDLVFVIPDKLEKLSAFKSRFQQIIGGQEDDFKELRAAIFLDKLEAIVPEDSRAEINLLKKDLLLRFSVKIQQGLRADDLEKLAVDSITRLKILDEIRKMISDQELKNQLNIFRQKLLDQIVNDQLVNRQEAQLTLEKASSSIVILSLKTKDRSLLEQARFYFDQAERFFKKEDFSHSFNQSVLAIGIAEDGLRQLTENNIDSRLAINVLKKDFDRLMLLVEMNKIQREDQPELFGFIDKAEKLIARASDKDFAVSQLQEVKILLANIDLLLSGYLKKEKSK